MKRTISIITILALIFAVTLTACTNEEPDNTPNNPVDDPIDNPNDDPADDPVDDPTDDPVDEPNDDPIDDPDDETNIVGGDRGDGDGIGGYVPDYFEELKCRQAIADTAKSLLGIPYFWSGTTPETGFDSSGLIYYVLRQNGYENFPRMIVDQVQTGVRFTDYDKLQVGDIMFFNMDKDATEAGFGGIYIGDGMMIYSPYEGLTVCETDITKTWWREYFVFAVTLDY